VVVSSLWSNDQMFLLQIKNLWDKKQGQTIVGIYLYKMFCKYLIEVFGDDIERFWILVPLVWHFLANLLRLLVGARGRRPLWSPPWVPMTFGRQCEVLEVLFFLIFYSLFGPCPARLALSPAPPCPAPCPCPALPCKVSCFLYEFF
jgi:hypothetical protein